MQEVSREHLLAHFQQVLERIVADAPHLERRLVSEALLNWQPRRERNFGAPIPGHNVSLPGVMAMQGIGYLFKESGSAVGKDPEDYIKLIVKLAHAVLDERFRGAACRPIGPLRHNPTCM